MGSGGVAIAALPTVICLKVSFSDGLGGVNRADIGGKSGNKVKDCHVTIIRSLLSQIKENSLRVLLTYRKLFTINTKIAVEFIINSCIVYYKRSPHLL